MTNLTGFSVVPSRKTPSTFSDYGDTHMTELVTFVSELNIMKGEIELDATIASGSATTATAQASISTTKAAEASASAITSAASANVSLWVSGQSVTQWAVKVSPANGQSYRKITATGSTTTDPSLDFTNYVAISTTGSVVKSSRTSNTILTIGDHRKLIELNGAFDQTFDSCANLGSGWWCIYRNMSSQYTISLNPYGSELIDGMATFNVYPLECRLIQCDGSTLTSIVLSPFFFTAGSSFTFYKPPGYKAFNVMLWGGGGSGYKRNSSVNRFGGGGGACVVCEILSVLVASSESIVIGGGGAGQTTDSVDGNPGGSSTFNVLWAGGGAGGSGSSTLGGEAFSSIVTSANNVAGSVANEFNYMGGGVGILSTVYGSVYGGGGGAGILSTGAVSSAGTSIFGGAGGASSVASSGSDGAAPGGGGGATATGASSGAGARGEIRMRGVI